MKALDANRYATKKTIAQGMLDIALLTANASQLKYILQVGAKHEFYRLMLTLITISISLQVPLPRIRRALSTLNHLPLPFPTLPHPPTQIGLGVMDLTLTLMRDRKLHLLEYHWSANLLNSLGTVIALFITLLNLFISALDPSAAIKHAA